MHSVQEFGLKLSKRESNEMASFSESKVASASWTAMTKLGCSKLHTKQERDICAGV